MKVFLKKDVPGVGKAQQVVNVAGYARNFLMPVDWQFRLRRARSASRGSMRRAQSVGKSVYESTLRPLRPGWRARDPFQGQSRETGRLYGSITTADIAEKIAQVLGTISTSTGSNWSARCAMWGPISSH